MIWLASCGGCRTSSKIIPINYFSLFWLHQKRWLFGSAIRDGFRKWNHSSFSKFQKRPKWSPTLKSCLKICIFLVNKSVLIIIVPCLSFKEAVIENQVNNLSMHFIVNSFSKNNIIFVKSREAKFIFLQACSLDLFFSFHIYSLFFFLCQYD